MSKQMKKRREWLNKNGDASDILDKTNFDSFGGEVYFGPNNEKEGAILLGKGQSVDRKKRSLFAMAK